MKVTLKHSTPTQHIVDALLTCTGKVQRAEQFGRAFIKKWAIDAGHGSVLEHKVFHFYIEGISRALLQELVRHRMASFTVRSTRYTLAAMLDEYAAILFGDEPVTVKTREMLTLVERYYVLPSGLDPKGDLASPEQLKLRQSALASCLSNLAIMRDLKAEGLKMDQYKYECGERLKVDLAFTINARSLRNLLELRLSPAALPEFQELALKLYTALDEDDRYLFQDLIPN